MLNVWNSPHPYTKRHILEYLSYLEHRDRLSCSALQPHSEPRTWKLKLSDGNNQQTVNWVYKIWAASGVGTARLAIIGELQKGQFHDIGRGDNKNAPRPSGKTFSLTASILWKTEIIDTAYLSPIVALICLGHWLDHQGAVGMKFNFSTRCLDVMEKLCISAWK